MKLKLNDDGLAHAFAPERVHAVQMAAWRMRQPGVQPLRRLKPKSKRKIKKR